jgi:NAD(P)-dependent dehydrogenase (short-subunit alcohol dehydrogenase family)
MSSNLEAGAPVALITGGARGLGYATGESLVKRGYRVALVDIDGEGSQSAAQRLSPQAAIGLQCDVASDNDVESVTLEIERRFGRLDTLVNNAGGVDPGRTQEVSTTSWTNLVDVHLGGTFRMCRAAFRLLSASDQPSIVNISSISAHRGLPGRASYNSAKAAIESFTRTLAVEWAQVGIRVNAVAPGFILTEGARAVYESGAADYQQRLGYIPLGRMGSPGEIGEAVAWLASQSASYVTGQVLVVDGGYLVDGRTGGDDWVLAGPAKGRSRVDP